MAVYEHTYKPYQGNLTRAWSRFLILPRYAYRDVFESKLFTAFFALCFAYPLIASILIYLHHNVNALAIFKLDVRSLVPIDATFFQTFVVVQGMFGFFLNLLIGPALVSRDLSNNALPLYLCRPFSRAEYVIGKMSVLAILLSLVTWIPGLLLFFFQSYLEGGGWMIRNFWMAGSILLGSLICILILSLLSLAVSAWVKWRMAASAVLLALFFVPAVLAEIINNLFVTRWGSLISLGALMRAAWQGLFGTFSRQTVEVNVVRGGEWSMVPLNEPPLWCSWAALLIICGFCLLLLVRKVRAYEVVS